MGKKRIILLSIIVIFTTIIIFIILYFNKNILAYNNKDIDDYILLNDYKLELSDEKLHKMLNRNKENINDSGTFHRLINYSLVNLKDNALIDENLKIIDGFFSLGYKSYARGESGLCNESIESLYTKIIMLNKIDYLKKLLSNDMLELSKNLCYMDTPIWQFIIDYANNENTYNILKLFIDSGYPLDIKNMGGHTMMSYVSYMIKYTDIGTDMGDNKIYTENTRNEYIKIQKYLSSKGLIDQFDGMNQEEIMKQNLKNIGF